jgi:hypothetical protein
MSNNIQSEGYLFFVMLWINVFLQHGVNYKWVTIMCVSLVPIGIIASYEIDGCVILLCSLCIYYGSIVHIVNNCIISDEAGVLYYGFIAKFYWLI